MADFRDLWVDNPYYNEPGWRRPLDAILERYILRRSAGLVTVSPIWAEQLRRRHGKPVTVVYNGYAAEDFPPHAPRDETGEFLTIRYLGSIYLGFRDPSPLFAAVALRPPPLRTRIRSSSSARKAMRSSTPGLPLESTAPSLSCRASRMNSALRRGS